MQEKKQCKRSKPNNTLMVQVNIDWQNEIPRYIRHFFYEMLHCFQLDGTEWMLVRVVRQDLWANGAAYIQCEPRWYETDTLLCISRNEEYEKTHKIVISDFQRGVQYMDRVDAADLQAEIDAHDNSYEHVCVWNQNTMEKFVVGDQLVLVHEVEDFPFYELTHSFFVVKSVLGENLLIVGEVEQDSNNMSFGIPSSCLFRSHHYEMVATPLWSRPAKDTIAFFQIQCVCVREWQVHNREGVLQRFDPNIEYCNYSFRDPLDGVENCDESTVESCS